MIIGHEDGFAVGGSRYGSRKNAKPGDVCPKCQSSDTVADRDAGQGAVRCKQCDKLFREGFRENAGERESLSYGTERCSYCHQMIEKHTLMTEVAGEVVHSRCLPKLKRVMEELDREEKMDNSDPIARHENARAAGQDRYGSRKNASLECPKSGCGKSFDDKGQLQRHPMGAHGVEREIARARAEGVADPGRENADGGCAHCGHSFYQHSTGYDNQWHCKPGCKCDGFYIANAGPMRCSCGGKITKVGDDRFECDDCGQMYESDDWHSDRLKAIENADPQKCAGCGASIPDGEGSYRHDKPYCDKCTNPGLHNENYDPIARHDNARAAGQDRYGSRKNAAIGKTAMVDDFKCPKCGDSGRIQVDRERGICVDCAKKMD